MKRLNDKRRWIATPTSSARNDGQERKKGFTLVELVIVIAIVIILSVVSVPIYRGYTRNAKMSEGYALLGMILSSQKAYFSQYGNFLHGDKSSAKGWNVFTCNEEVLGIDARGNKYFSLFRVGGSTEAGVWFRAEVIKPKELRTDQNLKILRIEYSLTSGAAFTDNLDGDYAVY